MSETSVETGITRKHARLIAAGSIGTLIEYYDYYLYGLAAAAIFPTLFFATHDATVSTLASFATFAFGFLLRPIGGLIFGHIGDRYGRRTTLLITVIGMGIATTAIGFLPTEKSIGSLAPILLILCRMFQGLFVGGEMGGAATMVVENAPKNRHGLFGALLITGAGVASVLSSGSMALLGSGSQSFFISIGWRIPFWFALVLAIIAVILRRRISESEQFLHAQSVQAQTGITLNPLREALRHPKNLILSIFIGLPQSISGYVLGTFGLAYMLSHGVRADIGFVAGFITGVLMIVISPLWGLTSDRFGRRKVYIFGCIALAVVVGPTFLLYSTNVPLLIWIAGGLSGILATSPMQSILQTMYVEMFDTESRTIGVNIGYQFSNTIGGGFAPLICTALVAATHGAMWPVIIYVVVICTIGALTTLWATVEPHAVSEDRVRPLAVSIPTPLGED